MPQTSTSQPGSVAAPRWGRCWVDATREAPRVAWGVLSDQQTDSLFLHCIRGVSQTEIARRYGVTQSTVCGHVRHALERLSAAPMPAPDDDPSASRASRVSCCGCPHPGVPCRRCLEVVMRQRS
jgi:hypothetical protein